MFYNIIMVVFVLRVRSVKILPFELSQGEVDLAPVQVPVTAVRDAKVSLLSFSQVRVVMASQEVVGLSVCNACTVVRDLRRTCGRSLENGSF